MTDAIAALAFTEVSLRFLPPGKAPLVLILGGLLVLSASLAWSIVTPRPAAVRPARAAPVPRASAPAPAAARVPREAVALSPGFPRTLEGGAVLGESLARATDARAWSDVVEMGRRVGLGQLQILSLDRSRGMILVAQCRSCRERGTRGGRHDCAFEAGFLQGAAGVLAPAARVREISCDADGRRDCAFEIRFAGDAR